MSTNHLKLRQMEDKLRMIVLASDCNYLKNSVVWDIIKDYVTVKRQNTVIDGKIEKTEDVFYMEFLSLNAFKELVELLSKKGYSAILDFYYYRNMVHMIIDI